MPQAADEKVATFHRWKGLNLRETANAISDTELTDVVNFNLTDGGELVKRTGFTTKHAGATLGAFPVKMLGFFNTTAVQQFIARAGTNLYQSSDTITWTLIAGGPWGNIEHGVQYTDKFYMVRRDSTIVQWDGTTATAIAGTPSGSFCRVFKDRLFVVNSYGTGAASSRVYFSEPFDFTATGWPATNYIGVNEGDGDFLVALVNVQDYLIVFKTGGMWIVYIQGAFANGAWILRPFNSEVGCISKSTIVLYEGLLFFLSSRGVYQTDGNTVKSISNSIQPVFDNFIISTTSINQSSAFIWKDKYVMVMESFPNAATWASWSTQTWSSLVFTPWLGATYTWLAYHIRQKGWTKYSPATGFDPHVFVTVNLSSLLRGVYGGARSLNGKVFKFGNTVYQDDTTSYTVLAETKETDFGSPTERKRGKWIGLDTRSTGVFTLQHVVDGNAQTALSVTATPSQQEQKLAGPGYFRSWRAKFSATHANQVALYGMSLLITHRRQIEKATP